MATLRVRGSFACIYQGVEEVFAAGRLVDASDPVVKGREHLFEPVEVAASRQSLMGRTAPAPVEQATAAPGEKRSVAPSKPKGK